MTGAVSPLKDLKLGSIILLNYRAGFKFSGAFQHKEERLLTKFYENIRVCEKVHYLFTPLSLAIGYNGGTRDAL
ncbi:MAG TPA: hypothetical protein VFC84_05010 [Desulfosporosinus sp.]|nr:hypothetical protein [Desulfosporosinus sp.]